MSSRDKIKINKLTVSSEQFRVAAKRASEAVRTMTPWMLPKKPIDSQ